MNSLGQGFRKLDHYKQTDRQTDRRDQTQYQAAPVFAAFALHDEYVYVYVLVCVHVGLYCVYGRPPKSRCVMQGCIVIIMIMSAVVIVCIHRTHYRRRRTIAASPAWEH